MHNNTTTSPGDTKAALPTAPGSAWIRFFFEANHFFDYIESLADWQRLRDAYPDFDDDRLLSAKEATYRGTLDPAVRAKHPNFGFRYEHDGEKSLRDFFAENEMPLPNAQFSDAANDERKTP